MTYIMLYICTNISLVLSNDVSEVPDTGLINLSSINHIIKTNVHLYTCVQILLSLMACIVLYIYTNISLMLLNDVSEVPDTSLMNVSSINHIIKANQHFYSFV